MTIEDNSTSNHSKLYKNYGKSYEAIRKNRQTTNIELRKSRREDIIQKKRNINIPTEQENDPSFAPSSPTNLDEIRQLVQECMSSDPEMCHKAILRLRLYLTMENVPFMDELLNQNIVGICAARLSQNESIEVRYNATWALTNIASGPTYQTQYLLKSEIISALGSLLLESYSNLVEQSVWALSNIIGDGPTARSFVLNLNLLPCLLNVFTKNSQNRGVVKQISWMLINICRKKEAELEVKYLPTIIPLISKLLEYQDEMIVSDTLWAITHLADSSHQHITALIQGGIVDKIFNFFSSTPKIALSALRSVGNVAASIDDHTQYLITNNIYAYLQPLFSTTNQKVKKEVYWLLSNIAAGTRPQMLTLFQLNIFDQILYDLEFAEYEIKREACWVIANVLHTCTIAEAQPFIDSRVLTNMNKFLVATDVSMIIVVLEVFLILLKLYANNNQLSYICEKIEECGALDAIENLQSHPNKTIYSFTSHILEKYFSEDDNSASNTQLAHPQSGITEELSKSNNMDQSHNEYNF